MTCLKVLRPPVQLRYEYNFKEFQRALENVEESVEDLTTDEVPVNYRNTRTGVKHPLLLKLWHIQVRWWRSVWDVCPSRPSLLQCQFATYESSRPCGLVSGEDGSVAILILLVVGPPVPAPVPKAF